MSFKEYPDTEQIQALGPDGTVVDLTADRFQRLVVADEAMLQVLQELLGEVRKLTAMMAEFMGGEC